MCYCDAQTMQTKFARFREIVLIIIISWTPPKISRNRRACLQHCKGTKQQNIRCIASNLKFLWYGSMEWNMEENFSMEWNVEENFSMEWKIFGMEWKKIASMEYGKIVFHSIPYHALTAGSLIIRYESKLGSLVIKAFIATLDYDLD